MPGKGQHHSLEARKKISISKIGKYKGKDNPHWKGGLIFDRDGYILLLKPNHPFCNSIGYIREHRLIMEEKLGRYLTPTEKIHHINGIRSDNRIKNLVLCQSGGKHAVKYHIKRDKRGRFM